MMGLNFSQRRLLRPYSRREGIMAYDYPYTVNSTEFGHREVTTLGITERWDEMINKIKEQPSQLVNCTEPILPGEPPPPLRTPLHYTAAGGAPKKIIVKLLRMGASRCMKTEEGRTAYDLAKAAGRDADILKLLTVPGAIQRDLEAIGKMEAGLHSVINDRVEDLVRRNGQRLPQLALLFEFSRDGGFYYSVPGMFGGFCVYRVENGIRVDSEVRICGGTEQSHSVDREGNVTRLPIDGQAI